MFQGGFWPTSRIELNIADHMEKGGTLHEEYAEDPIFVGRRRDRPRPSFRVGKDTMAGYFVVVRPSDGDPKPFWLARALTNPSPNSDRLQEIRVQYWTPVSGKHINMDTYVGWNSQQGVS